MDIDLQQLEASALKVRGSAYAPYSGFGVGAAILGESGKIYSGCNVENNSFGLTVCAERTAVFKAVSEGEKRFRAIAIVTDSEKPATPCGGCRQVLAEFNPDMVVVMSTMNGDRKIKNLKDLFPDPFVIH